MGYFWKWWLGCSFITLLFLSLFLFVSPENLPYAIGIIIVASLIGIFIIFMIKTAPPTHKSYGMSRYEFEILKEYGNLLQKLKEDSRNFELRQEVLRFGQANAGKLGKNKAEIINEINSICGDVKKETGNYLK